MRVLVTHAVTPLFHRSSGSVAKLHRDRLGGALGDGFHRARERLVCRVGFGSCSQVYRRLRQRQVALGNAQEMGRLLRADRLFERAGIRQADVFDRHADQPARDVQAILAGFEHPGQPVKRGIDIGRADALVERRDQVVVLLTGLVVEQHLPFDHCLYRLAFEQPSRRHARCQLQDVIRGARVAVGVNGDLLQQFFRRGELQDLQRALQQ